ncbi:sigma-54 interaction domain-containing protein [Ectobacillus ponti]|uniref:Sigma 54-interacting transcriptional regulator n=1 Tax=Ectobacillus ponti TaxID=2961894 RepID=A0AA41XD34_9BACI|nr:sigma 54-interacting transcriptional regulator [Ectobacillus ponti]MCP8969871.1 sigma 54-interacting transcriptional regulator [Ectobacillus ponti]
MTAKLNALPYEWLEEIINLAAEWIVVVDVNGIICYINQAYCEFLGTTIEEAVGKPVGNVIENSRMHVVVRTGQAEVASIQSIKGSEMVANRYPLYVQGELVGAVGTVMFRNAQDWLEYSQKVQPLVEELKYYKTRFERELRGKYRFSDLIGQSPRFLEAKHLAERVSGSQSAVLLLGESGTGKELFAHAIHNNSVRSPFPFVRVNCASIPEHLLESELFGYEEGAFTGAKRGGKKGKFELAHRGTLFLDEVGDMPLPMQSKLLRALQEKEIERIGGHAPVLVDVRIIAATHRNLEQMVEEGRFRQDLYYRLNVMKIEIPPLRERKADIGPISRVLLEKLGRKFNRHGIMLAGDVVQQLQQHNWPGNIRELENVLERAVNVLEGPVIGLHHLPLYLQDDMAVAHREHRPPVSCTQKNPALLPLKDAVAAAEREAIMLALQFAQGNKVQAARLLGIGKTSLYDKCKLYGID